jgi:hypothetical protein
MAAADCILKVDHVAIALPSIAESVPLSHWAAGSSPAAATTRPASGSSTS